MDNEYLVHFALPVHKAEMLKEGLEAYTKSLEDLITNKSLTSHIDEEKVNTQMFYASMVRNEVSAWIKLYYSEREQVSKQRKNFFKALVKNKEFSLIAGKKLLKILDGKK